MKAMLAAAILAGAGFGSPLQAGVYIPPDDYYYSGVCGVNMSCIGDEPAVPEEPAAPEGTPEAGAAGGDQPSEISPNLVYGPPCPPEYCGAKAPLDPTLAAAGTPLPGTNAAEGIVAAQASGAAAGAAAGAGLGASEAVREALAAKERAKAWTDLAKEGANLPANTTITTFSDGRISLCGPLSCSLPFNPAKAPPQLDGLMTELKKQIEEKNKLAAEAKKTQDALEKQNAPGRDPSQSDPPASRSGSVTANADVNPPGDDACGPACVDDLSWAVVNARTPAGDPNSSRHPEVAPGDNLGLTTQVTNPDVDASLDINNGVALARARRGGGMASGTAVVDQANTAKTIFKKVNLESGGTAGDSAVPPWVLSMVSGFFDGSRSESAGSVDGLPRKCEALETACLKREAGGAPAL